MNFLQQPEAGVEKKIHSSCVLCDLAAGGDDEFDRENYILFRGVNCYVVLNAFPYAAGHLMVVPKLHVGDLLALNAKIISESMDLVKIAIGALKSTYDPEGFNFGANLGRAGGAAFGDHVHFHVVPRWLGDTNFMTTMAHARVIPEALNASFERLSPLF